MILKLKRPIGFCLGIALALKLNRCLAQEDTGGYRHEFYREDNDRMNIDTDSASFDLGLGSHVRLNGLLVIDAISGATPTGAPPPATWPQLNFNNYYSQNYAVNYNNFYQSALNGFLPLYQAGLFNTNPNPYQAFTNYVLAHTFPSIPTQAGTTTSNNFKNSIANSPSYNSKQVPLAQLHDLRRAASFGAPITFGINTITPQLSISKESDYHSYGMALNDAVALNDKNTTLNLGWSHDADRVRDYTLVTWQPKVSDDVIIGINQLLTPKSYFSVDLSYGQEYGYLSDPYRGVFFANSLQNDPANAALYFDTRPRTRKKGIFYASYTQFIDTLDGSIDVSYRFFRDTYGVSAQTLDTAWHQKITRYFVFSPGFRYYYQTAASFYQVIFPDVNNPPEYYSSDYRLSRLQSFNVSADLTYRVHKYLAFDVSYSRYIMQGLDGVTSQTAYPSANVYSLGARIFF